jgi:4,5-DOPA dioxygenase extradiol
LVKMYPHADIPVFQLSLDLAKGPEYHYQLGKALALYRRKGLLIIGSGNIVHNLRTANFGTKEPYDWALEFDALSASLIEKREHQKLINYKSLGEAARLSIPTPEHYLPLLYILAMQEKNESVKFFNEGIEFGSGGMRSLLIS